MGRVFFPVAPEVFFPCVEFSVELGNSAVLCKYVMDEEGSGCNRVILDTGEPNVNSTLFTFK